MKLSYDLHLHSCLSPCGDDDMLPSNIVGMAALKGLDVIALTDHNTCRNCEALMQLAEAYGVLAIPGMELCTEEEVHVVCLFPSLEAAEEFESYVEKALPPIPNRADIFGKQQIVDCDDNVVGEAPYLLVNAAAIRFDDVHDLVAPLGGIMIPAHIDKASNSLLSNLGIIPQDSRFVCYELAHPEKREELEAAHPFLLSCNMITDSDAHYLQHIHEPEHFLEAEEKSVDAVLRALRRRSD